MANSASLAQIKEICRLLEEKYLLSASATPYLSSALMETAFREVNEEMAMEWAILVYESYVSSFKNVDVLRIRRETLPLLIWLLRKEGGHEEKVEDLMSAIGTRKIREQELILQDIDDFAQERKLEQQEKEVS